ncbi:MAG TPA: type 4a pilus biogenesis protein PilO [Candidatus Bathyarchaeia archaeon]|nr:type 4a pilus biogenesis protein PilO [Candidatus Bathyarchaeia archaeon]
MGDFKTKKQIIVAALAVLLLADGALVYFNSKLSTPQSNRQQVLAAQTRQLALVKADIERASKIRETIPDILKKFDQFEATLLPAGKGYSVITQELDDYARDSHLLVGDVQYHPKEVTGRSLTELSMEASVTGDYNGIVSFLNRLQRSKNVYIVDSLAVDTVESEHGPAGTLRVSLHMRTYFRKA